MSKLTLNYNNWFVKSTYEGYQMDLKYFWEVTDFGLMFTLVGEVKLKSCVNVNWFRDHNTTRSIVI